MANFAMNDSNGLKLGMNVLFNGSTSLSSALSSCSGTPPSCRFGHATASDDQYLFVYGGCKDTAIGRELTNELYSFNLNTRTWKKKIQKGQVPNCGFLSQMCLSNNQLFLFGGSGLGCPISNIMYKFDLSTCVWRQLHFNHKVPFARHGHSMIKRGGKLFLFGGCTGSVYFNDLWSFDLINEQWEKLGDNKKIINSSCSYHRLIYPTIQDYKTKYPNERQPTPRFGHTSHTDDDFLYIIGGGIEEEVNEELEIFKFEYKTAVWARLEFKSDFNPRNRHNHASVLFNNKIFICGGSNGVGNFDDIWYFDLNLQLWSQVSVRENPISFHTMNLVKNTLWVFGGREFDRTYGRTTTNKISACFLEIPTLEQLSSLCTTLHKTTIMKHYKNRFTSLELN